MYAPDKYRELRPDVLIAAIEAARFATVVGCTTDGPEAVHVPLLVGSANGETWLEGHVSRKNPIIGMIPDGTSVLAVFNGPNAYVSPTWIAEGLDTGRTAPTWAYIAVQAKGAIEWRTEERWLRDHVAALTDTSERSVGSDWSTSRMPEDYAAGLIGGITGFRISLRSLEGVCKVLQHSGREAQDSVAAAMRQAGGPQSSMADAIASGVEQ